MQEVTYRGAVYPWHWDAATTLPGVHMEAGGLQACPLPDELVERA